MRVSLKSLKYSVGHKKWSKDLAFINCLKPTDLKKMVMLRPENVERHEIYELHIGLTLWNVSSGLQGLPNSVIIDIST